LGPAIFLPFAAGPTVLLQVGPLALRQEGCLAVLLLATRFASILTVSLVLFGVAPFLTTVKAMRALGLPPLLADMTLLSYRYLYEIDDDLGRMETATRLRGFQAHRFSRRNLGTLAALAGSLLVRSYEQSQRIYHAMLLRGYGRAPRRPDEFRAGLQDKALLGLTLAVAGGFVAAELWLRQGGG
jgi:cobalt/nickel transport system permease protein